jgi:hypothetical protein
MKTKITSYLQRLNLVGVESSLFIFRCCFGFLSLSFDELSREQVDIWIKQLNSAKLDEVWTRQKGLKSPSSILYFVVWHFRDKVLQEKGYVREVIETPMIAGIKSAKVSEIIDPLNREIHKFSAFEGVEFVGNLIGAWMLSCPKVSVLNVTGTLLQSKTNEIWIQSVFPDTFSRDELELLYKLDFWLHNALKDWKTSIPY